MTNKTDVLTTVELDRLSAAATPGEWLYRPQEYDDWGFIRTDREIPDFPYGDLDARYGEIVALSRGPFRANHDQHRQLGTDPYEPNGRFIVALVNAYRSGRLAALTGSPRPVGVEAILRDVKSLFSRESYPQSEEDALVARIDVALGLTTPVEKAS